MNRDQFHNSFNEYFDKNGTKFFHFYISTKEYSNDLEFNENLHQFFVPFFEEIKLKDKFNILNQVKLTKYLDEDYDADNPESEICMFYCQININELYDIIKINNFKKETIDIFRIESKTGNGLYDTFFAAKKVDLEHHPAPIDDLKFDGIFDRKTNDYNYQRQWQFGFKSLEDVNNWLISDENKIELKNKGCSLKQYTIDSDFVIEGHKQIIFQKTKSLTEAVIDWEQLNTKVNVDYDYILKRVCSVGPNNIYTPVQEDENLKKYNDGAEFLNPKRYKSNQK